MIDCTNDIQHVPVMIESFLDEIHEKIQIATNKDDVESIKHHESVKLFFMDILNFFNDCMKVEKMDPGIDVIQVFFNYVAGKFHEKRGDNSYTMLCGMMMCMLSLKKQVRMPKKW